jgi:uncharacterized protein (UPF0276 family)
LVRTGHADYYELLIDNFLHVPPAQLRQALGDAPVAFHIMQSRFLERDESALGFIAARIRELARELKPLYVSDHLLRFTVDGRDVLVLPELDYDAVFEHARRRISLWQQLLETQVFFENFPSFMPGGHAQPAFFEALVAATGMGLLFDFSNAICAWRNCGVEPTAWSRLLAQARHFHAAGYEVQPAAPFTVIDTHGQQLAEDTLHFMGETLARLPEDVTICIEWDRNISVESWSRSLETVQRLSRGSHV